MAIKKTAADEVAESPEAARFNFNSLNTLAVVSLATAVTGFGAVAGIITGHFALAQLKQQPKSGRGLAIAGLVVGYATIAFWVIGAIAMTALRVRYGFDGPMMIGPRQDDGGMMGWRD